MTISHSLSVTHYLSENEIRCGISLNL